MNFTTLAAASAPVATVTLTVCRQCDRTDCPLLADIITGTANRLRAVGECYHARLRPLSSKAKL